MELLLMTIKYENKKHSESANLCNDYFEERESVYWSVKQWRLLLLVSLSWKFHECPSIRYSVTLPTNTDPENRKRNRVLGVKLIIAKMLQFVPYVKANISWKFYKNPCIYFTVVLLKDTPGTDRQTDKQANQRTRMTTQPWAWRR